MNGSNYTIGITDASPIDNLRLLASCFTPFVSGDMSKRVDPIKVFPHAKSIFVVCVPCDATSIYSNLSSLGVGEDYHKRVKDILKTLAAELEEVHGSFKYKILVDSPTLCERSLAVRAGLGYFGKNGLVISPEFDSRFNIGVMLTDISFDAGCNVLNSWRETNPHANALRARRSRVSFPPFCVSIPTCQVGQIKACPLDCDLCIKACPNGALCEGKPLDAGLCIAYLTQKENLSENEEKLLHGQLYGCDICQNVCPKNVKHKTSFVNPKEILVLSDSEIRDKFGHTAMNWKTKLLKRNALILQIPQQKPPTK